MKKIIPSTNSPLEVKIKSLVGADGKPLSDADIARAYHLLSHLYVWAFSEESRPVGFYHPIHKDNIWSMVGYRYWRASKIGKTLRNSNILQVKKNKDGKEIYAAQAHETSKGKTFSKSYRVNPIYLNVDNWMVGDSNFNGVKKALKRVPRPLANKAVLDETLKLTEKFSPEVKLLHEVNLIYCQKVTVEILTKLIEPTRKSSDQNVFDRLKELQAMEDRKPLSSEEQIKQFFIDEGIEIESESGSDYDRWFYNPVIEEEMAG